jgi:hypothetical protein
VTVCVSNGPIHSVPEEEALPDLADLLPVGELAGELANAEYGAKV